MTSNGRKANQPSQNSTGDSEGTASLGGRGTLAAVISSIMFPLALTQFIASFAGSNMNVAISDIANDLGTTAHGVQTAITLFTLTMAALMIPGSKLTDIWGRKRCFMLGLVIYGLGALVASLAQGLTVFVVGYSVMQGIGSALMIPPIYILLTVVFSDLEPGLFLSGFGIGVKLTSSVNVVQSSWPEQDQGEISGLSRSVSNLGSSLGTALVGSALASTAFVGNKEYRAALIVMAVIGFIGLVAALLIPRDVMPAHGQS
jgi:MFS family permease